jgi:hypothetical protein
MLLPAPWWMDVYRNTTTTEAKVELPFFIFLKSRKR